MEKDFLNYSLKNREEFLEILSNQKELNMEFLLKNEVSFYLKKIYEKYLDFLHEIFSLYINEYNLNTQFDDCICDFITSMTPQIEDTSYITKDEYTNQVCCIEYNMIINIHKFSYELYSLNHEINEMDFFHGISLTELLDKNLITINDFRKESYYDIDNFNHIDIYEDIDYLKDTKMVDIYLLSILSDVFGIKEYVDVFDVVYYLNNKKLLSKSIFRYMITMEDAIKMKNSLAKPLLSTFFIIIFVLIIAIFLTVKILS